MSIPKIGSAFGGGIFAGMVAGANDQPDYYLVHATVDFEIFDTNWQDAIEAAQTPINGYLDWSLPDSREARLLAINNHDSFDADCRYWTSAQDVTDSNCAWVQHFDNGIQSYGHKSNEYRARAVRRLSVIE